MTAPVDTDVFVVGAGPIGLELAVALKRRNVDCIQVDAGQIGHTISWYPTAARFFSSPERIAIAGVPIMTVDQTKATKEEYLAYLRGIVVQFDLPVRTYERVIGLEKAGDRFLVRTESRSGTAEFRAKRVVLAVGDMARPRRLGIPGEDLPHVSHYFTDPHPYFRRQLVIVGGKNSAVEAAIRCHRTGARVAISYRNVALPVKSVKYWLLPEIESFIRQGHVDFFPGTVPERITETAITLRSLSTGESIEEPADFVLLLTGYEADTSLFTMAGVPLEGENRGPVHDPDTMETTVPGLYVAGTAAAGTQNRFRLFIENAHVHVDRIVAAVTGEPLVIRPTPGYSLPES